MEKVLVPAGIILLGLLLICVLDGQYRRQRDAERRCNRTAHREAADYRRHARERGKATPSVIEEADVHVDPKVVYIGPNRAWEDERLKREAARRLQGRG